MNHIIVLFELRSSFARADEHGLLDRNWSLFCRLLERGTYEQIYYFSYDRCDLDLLKQYHRERRLPAGVRLLAPPAWLSGKLGALIYSLVGPIIHRKTFKESSAIYTQQVSGAWTALVGKLLFRTPVLFRCGYPLSVRFEQERKSTKQVVTLLLEKVLMRASDHVGVTSSIMRDYYGAMNSSAAITVMPNYVDMSAFRQMEQYDKNQPILFVGRLAEVKNIANLITACGRLGLPLHVYGKGPLESELQAHATSVGTDVHFKGNVQNTELARLHHDHSIFVSCSFREGLPKAVVEAMASGLIVVGTKTDGLMELIEDGKTGYLIEGYDAEAIQAGLTRVLKNFDPDVGRRASRYVQAHYSLDSAVDVSENILRSIEKERDRDDLSKVRKL
jgi:glycosyltransferase involved in cell wall biosynthesis